MTSKFAGLLMMALTLLCQAVRAESATPHVARSVAAEKTCLVLSGGGARGLAHIGVLKRIEALHIPIQCIAGTSMGSVIGALYASGMSAETIEKLLLSVDWTKVANDRLDREQLAPNRKRDDFDYPLGLEMGLRDGQFRLATGLLSGVRFEMLLRKWLPFSNQLINFDHLPIPFRAVAANVETGEAVILSQGSLVGAIRASMAVPGLFSPVALDGQVLVDGGIAKNLPVDVARAMGATRIIAVDVSTTPARKDQLQNLLQIYQQMTSFLTSRNVKAQIALLQPQDLLITPDLSGMGFDAFDKVADFVARGTAAAELAEPRLATFSTSVQGFAHYRDSLQRPMPAAESRATRLEVSPQPHIPRDAIESLLDLGSRPKLDAQSLDGAMRRVLATGDFERVTFIEHQDPKGTWLSVDAREKSWGPNYFRFGMNTSLAAEGNGAIGLSLGHLRTWANAAGAEWRNDIQLGRTLGASTEWYQPLAVNSPWFASARYAFLQRSREFTDPAVSSKPALRANYSTNDVFFDLGYRIAQWGDIRAGLHRRNYWQRAAVGGFPVYDDTSATAGFADSDISGRETGGRVALYLDRLDTAFFPRKGFRLNADAFIGRSVDQIAGISGEDTLRRVNGDFLGAYTFGDLTISPRLRYSTVQGLKGNALADVTLGGFQMLSGTPLDSLSGNDLRFGRIDAYYALRQVDLFGRKLFAGGTLEVASLSSIFQGQDYGTLGVRKAFSVYLAMQSALGPLYAAYGHTLGGSSAIYLFLGRP